MYAKIYREIFIKNYSLKKHLKGNIWVVKVNDRKYYLYVFEDEEDVYDEEGNLLQKFNEAELLKYKDIEDVELRIKKNREFYESIKKFKSQHSYLFRKMQEGQGCLFSFDNFKY